MKIDVSYADVNRIITKSLKNTYRDLCEESSVPFFSTDTYEEAKERKKLKDSLKKVYWYYTGETLK